MKKFLLGTTAIVAAAAVAAPAVAAEKITLGLGGYMQSYIGFASQDDDTGVADYRVFDVQTDYEVYFQGSSTLDNGIKFAVKVEMEADGEDAGGTIDEAYTEVSSASFGALKLGYDDAVTSLAHHEAPNYGIGTNEYQGWLEPRNITYSNDTYLQIGQGDEAKISYFTPKFAGFQLGATYVPELEDQVASGRGPRGAFRSNIPNAVNGGGDAWFGVLAYDSTIGGVGIGADIGYGRASGGVATVDTVNAANSTVRDAEGYHGGLKLSYAGFEFGGAYERSMIKTQDGGAIAVGDGYTWNVGVGYKAGPWGVSILYLESEREGLQTVADDDKAQTVALSGIYNLGPGIDVHGSLIWAEYEEETHVDANENDGGWAVVAGFSLSF